jgi:hypothetical protein
MIDINVDEPVEHNGMEWISVKIHGQSFMLHQIVSVFNRRNTDLLADCVCVMSSSSV